MAKRFSDTDKWKKSWYRRLSPIYKVFWEYLRDNCDYAGVWEVDFDLAMFNIGGAIDPLKAKETFDSHIHVLSSNKWLLVDFIPYQYGCTAEELNPNNNVHKNVIRLLEKATEKQGQGRGRGYPYAGVLYKEQDKDKEQDKAKAAAPSGLKTETKKKLIEVYTEILPFYKDNDFYVAWSDHMDVRKKKKGAITQRANVHILNELKTLCKGNKQLAIHILDQSSRKGWIDVFELKKRPVANKEYLGALYVCPVCDVEYKYRQEGNHTCSNKSGKCEGWTDSKGENRRDPTLSFVKSIYKED